jgi:nucleoside-diphosphate-sugar epimerase
MPRAVVTGGAGSLGSHVCERLLEWGWAVVCLDTLLTERPVDDRDMRCPDIICARAKLEWEPRVGFTEGRERTIAWAGKTWPAH